jgi:hypothetical protein
VRRDGKKGKWQKREMGKDLNCKNHKQRQYPILKRTKSNKSSLRCFTYRKSKHKRARDHERLSRCESNLDMGITGKPQTDRQTDRTPKFCPENFKIRGGQDERDNLQAAQQNEEEVRIFVLKAVVVVTTAQANIQLP